LVDVSSVTAVTAAPAQSTAGPVTIDALFGALLQSVTEAESTALVAPSIQGAALALVLPANTPAGQQTGEQQDNGIVATSPSAPWLFAPVAPITQLTPSEPLPGLAAPAPNSQQGADSQVELSAAALPETTDTPVQTIIPAKENTSPLPAMPAAPAPVLVPSIQTPVSQEATPAAPQQTTSQPVPPQPVMSQQAPQSGLPSATEPPLPVAPEPVQVPAQTGPQTTSSQTTSSQACSSQTDSSQTTQQTAPLSSAVDVANQIVTPAPRDLAAVKSATSEEKTAAEKKAETPKRDDTTTTNAIVDVLAGFLLPQIEPIAVPANDATADTVDSVASTKSDDQASPVIAATDQNAAAPVQPMPVAVVQPPPAPVSAPVQADEQIAPAAVGQAPTPKNNAATDEPATPAVAQKPAARQQASHQTASEHSASQPAFVPANDTAADNKPDPQVATDPRTASATADTRTAATTDTPQPAQASAPNPAPQQPPIANPAIQPVAPSGLRKLTAGLQVAAQEQETTSSIDKLGLTIATKSIDGLRHFDIRLDPPELGRVQVQLTTDDTGRSLANVVVDKPQTLELLQRDSQNLNRALHDAGLDVSNNGLNFSLRDQSRQNDGGVDQERGRSLSVKAVMQTDATQIHSSLGSYAPNSVRLDIRV
jgi:chemotaxis protein MotD